MSGDTQTAAPASDSLAAAAAATTGTPAAAPQPATGTAPAPEAPKTEAPKVDPAAPYLPEGLDKTFHGKTDKETLDNLAKHLAGLPKPPEKPDGYTIGEAIAKAANIDVANDKVLPIARTVAHELGMSQPQFEGFIGKLYDGMSKAGLIVPSVDVNAEIATLGGELGDAASKMQKGMQRVNDLVAGLNGLATRGLLKQERAQTLANMPRTAQEIMALEDFLAALGGPKGAQNGPGSQSDGLSDEARRLGRFYPTMVVNR